MREKIIDYVRPKSANFMGSKEAFIMVLCNQLYYPIPYVFVLFFGDRFTQVCLTYCMINSITAIITAIVFRKRKTLNNTFSYFAITMSGWGVNFLVLAIAIYRFLYKSFIPCLIILGFAVCIVVLFIIFTKKYIKKKRKRKNSAKNYVFTGVGFAVPVIGRSIAAIIAPQLSQHQVWEIVAIILISLSVLGLILGIDYSMKLYYILKYKIDICEELDMSH